MRILSIILLGFLLFSCSKTELLNSEADIVEVILPDSLKVGSPIITNKHVRIPILAIRPNDIKELEKQLKSVTPKFTLTPGAIITFDGVARDFSEPQIYTVTSEDRYWSKDYVISFYKANFDQSEFSFTHFETSAGDNKYHIFYELDENSSTKQYMWDSGNSGFAIVNNPPAENYPTSSTPYGKIGSGAKLVTCSTGPAGAGFGKPIAAGNLFLGYFESKIAIFRPLEATHFGNPSTIDQPKTLSLWAKYKAGPEYKDVNGNIVPGMIDRPEIYAVLYEPEIDQNGNAIKLNGKNIRTSDNIISIAVMSDEQVDQIRVNNIESDEYMKLEIPFTPRKLFDPEKQKNGSYYLTVVFSSSAKGNLFEGAIGSTLCVDEVKFETVNP